VADLRTSLVNGPRCYYLSNHLNKRTGGPCGRLGTTLAANVGETSRPARINYPRA
jgi:hypothetical protein